MKKIYIIILNYNGWQDTIECLESVLKSSYGNYQIIVVDNNSPNNSLDYIIKWADGQQEVIYNNNSQLKHLSVPFSDKPISYILYTEQEATTSRIFNIEAKYHNPLILIQADKNSGFAGGNNVGIKYALRKKDFSYIWLLNNDTVIEYNALHQLYEYAECNNTGISGSVLKYYHAPDSIQAYGGRLNTFLGTTSHNKTISMLNKRLDDIIGATFFLNEDVISNIGLLPEEYFLYMEETDYCFNARKNGFKLGVATDSIVYHKEGASIGASSKNNDKKSEFADLLSIENRIKFHKKYLGGGIGLYLGLVITIINRLKRRQWNRVVKIIKLLNEK